VPFVTIDGITTRYETLGSGPPLLMYPPGAEPEDLMRLDIPALVVPGHDASHATSAARYLEECLPRSDYWDVPVEGQDEDATNARVLEFLAKVGA
jgi:hypothetical protein